MGKTLDETKINKLGPVIIEMNGSKYDLEFVCVDTGCARINVCGLGQNCQWGDFSKVFDWDYNEYSPDYFYVDA